MDSTLQAFSAIFIGGETFFMVMATLPMIMREVRSGRRAGCGGREPRGWTAPVPASSESLTRYYDELPMAPWQPPELVLVTGWVAAYFAHATAMWLLWRTVMVDTWAWTLGLASGHASLLLQTLWVVLFYWVHARDVALPIRFLATVAGLGLCYACVAQGVWSAAGTALAWVAWLSFVTSMDCYTHAMLCGGRSAGMDELFTYRSSSGLGGH